LFGVLIVGCIVIAFSAATFLGTEVNRTFSRIGTEFGDFMPMGTVAGFYGSLDQGDYSTARSLLTEDFASQWSADDLRRAWESLEAAEGNILVATLPEISEEQNGVIDARQVLTANNGNTFTVDLTLVESDGIWLIDDASPSLIP
jgi:hypothetical protein